MAITKSIAITIVGVDKVSRSVLKIVVMKRQEAVVRLRPSPLGDAARTATLRTSSPTRGRRQKGRGFQANLLFVT